MPPSTQVFPPAGVRRNLDHIASFRRSSKYFSISGSGLAPFPTLVSTAYFAISIVSLYRRAVIAIQSLAVKSLFHEGGSEPGAITDHSQPRWHPISVGESAVDNPNLGAEV